MDKPPGRPLLTALSLGLALGGALGSVCGWPLDLGRDLRFAASLAAMLSGPAILAGWVLVLVAISRNEKGTLLQMFTLFILWIAAPFWMFRMLAMWIMSGPYPSLT